MRGSEGVRMCVLLFFAISCGRGGGDKYCRVHRMSAGAERFAYREMCMCARHRDS